MRSSSSLLSPPPSPHPVPLPLSTSSSSLTHCPELDLSVTLCPVSKTHKTGQKNDKLHPKPHPRSQTRRKRSTQVGFKEPVAITSSLAPHVTLSRDTSSLQQVRGQMKSTGRYQAPKLSVKPPPTSSNQGLGCLERAEWNTTLALKAELQSLQGAEFNARKAIQETLQKSDRAKILINTRATDVVNVSRSQHLFTSLISVNVQQDELISQALQERLLLAPSPQCHDKTADGPSLLLFMTHDLFRQKPLPPDEEPVDSKPHPSTWPAHSTFDLYRRQRAWEAMP